MMTQDRLNIRLFGKVEIEINGEVPHRLRTRQSEKLLFALMLAKQRPVLRQDLCELLWPESTFQQARISLRQSLFDLRHVMGCCSSLVESHGTDAVRLSTPSSIIEVDLLRFDTLCAAPRNSDEQLDEVLRLYRGPLLESHSESWITAERDARQKRLVDYMVRFAKSKAATNPQRFERTVKHAISIAPLSEDANFALIAYLSERGRVAEALACFTTFRTRHIEVTGVDVSASLLHLTRSIRALQTRSDHPESIEKHKTDCSVESYNPKTRLIGREKEFKALDALMKSNPVVTITGTGGIGKTRLATEWAAANLERDTVTIHLAHLNSPSLLLGTILHAFGLQEVHHESLIHTLCRHLNKHAVTILLDNCEHLTKHVAHLVTEILMISHDTRILITSREPLLLAGESILYLEPLEVPACNTQDIDSASVTLLLESLKGSGINAMQNDWELSDLRELCRRSEGIPLALELTAAQLQSVTPKRLLEMTEHSVNLTAPKGQQLPIRHHTMESCIEFGYRLLNQDEQRIFRHLCIFEDGFTLNAAKYVCGGDMVVENLDRLMQASFIRQRSDDFDQIRFGMLETIRQFGLQKLKETREFQSMREQHFNWICDHIRTQNGRLRSMEEADALTTIRRESSNWRFALEHANDLEFVTLVILLRRYWGIIGHPMESRTWFDQALLRVNGLDVQTRAETHMGAGVCAWQQQDTHFARTHLEEAVSLAEVSGNDELLGHSLNNLSAVLRAQNEPALAFAALERAVNCFERLGNQEFLASAVSNLGRAASEMDQCDISRDLLIRGMDLYMSSGDQRGYTTCQLSLADNEARAGRDVSAKEHYLASLESLSIKGDTLRQAWAFDSMSTMQLRMGQFRDAAVLKGLAKAYHARVGNELPMETDSILAQEFELLRNDLGEEFEAILKDCEGWSNEQAIGFVRGMCVGEDNDPQSFIMGSR